MSNTVTLPWPPKECSPNYHGGKWKAIEARRKYRDECYYIARQARLNVPLTGNLQFELEFFQPGQRRTDDDNLISAVKHGRDGVALAIGRDDSCFRTHVKRIAHDKAKRGYVVVTLRGEA